MPAENKKNRTQKTSSRSIDRTGRSAYRTVHKRFSLVQNRQISTWKSLSLITFFAGLMAASIWFSSYHLEQDTLVVSTKIFSSAKSQDTEKVERGGQVGRAENHILVKFKEGISSEKRQAALAKHSLKEKSEIKGIGVKIIEFPSGNAPENVIKKMLENDKDLIEFAEVDALIAPSFVPNDLMYPNQWHLAKMNTSAAWDSTKSSGVTVAVLDTGVDCTHPDLALNCVPGWNFYDNNSDASDIQGHGTRVAGTVAALGENLIGVAGVAYQAKIMPIRISDPAGWGYWSAVASGITWAADRGARVATNSYESTSSSTVQSAANYLRNKGGLFVASAGNSGALLAGTNVDSVITVGATDSADNKTSWSNYGPQIDVTAPGIDIYTTSAGGGYAIVAGTSFSAPNTAAVLALVFSLKPGLSSAQAENILKSSAIDLGAAGRDDSYGFGRVDAAAAVAAALGVSVPTPDTTSPTAPSNLAATVTAPNVQLTWNAATDNVGVTGYVIYRDSKQVATATNTNYTDTSVTAGMTYAYTVKASDAAGNLSSSSNSVSVSMPNATPSFTISNVSISAKTSTTATVVWTTSLASTSAVKYGTQSNALTVSVLASQSRTTQSVTLPGLLRKTRYYYQVTATGPNGEIATSSVLNFVTKP